MRHPRDRNGDSAQRGSVGKRDRGNGCGLAYVSLPALAISVGAAVTLQHPGLETSTAGDIEPIAILYGLAACVAIVVVGHFVLWFVGHIAGGRNDAEGSP